MGLAGIEAYYSGYSEQQTRRYAQLAARFGLVTSGGSDYHGDTKPDISLGRHGKLRVPDTLLQPLAERAQTIRRESRRERVGIEPT